MTEIMLYSLGGVGLFLLASFIVFFGMYFIDKGLAK